MKLKFREIDPTTGEETIVEQEFTLLNSAQYAQHVANRITGQTAATPVATPRKPSPPVTPNEN